MSKPHITILHYTAPPVVGGVENVIAEHTCLLREAGYPVTIIAGRGGDPETLGGARVVVIPDFDSDNPENRKAAEELAEGGVLSEFTRLQARIEKRLVPKLAKSDVVIAHNILNFHFNLPLTAALYSLLEQGKLPPLIAWCHDISRYVNPGSGAEQRFGFPWDLLRTAHPDILYVAVSSRRQQMLAETLRMPASSIHVVPNGVAPDTLLGLDVFGQRLLREFDLLNADLILLMPVRITQAKNIEFALHTMAALKDRDFNPKLIVTGPPDPHADDSQAYFEQLQLLRRSLGLLDKVIFLYEGMSNDAAPMTLDAGQVAQLYRLADIVFMPSHREGFGLPVLEGGLMHKAIFARRVPAVDEVGPALVNTIAPEERSDQVARRIREWADRDVEHRLARRVRREFTWQVVFRRQIEPLIAGLLNSTEVR